MDKFEVSLSKRNGKSVLYFIAAALIIFTLILTVSLMFLDYKWYHLLYTLILLLGLFLILKSIYQFVFYSEVRLVVRSDGFFLRFYNINDKDIQFNISRKYKLDSITNICIVEAPFRIFCKNYYFEIIDSSQPRKLCKDRVDAFPPLFESSAQDRVGIVNFVTAICPEIKSKTPEADN